VIFGCGGHGREILGIVRAVNDSLATDRRWRVVGFVDDHPTPVNLDRLERLGIPFLGASTWLVDAEPDTRYVIGVGRSSLRARLARRVHEYGLSAARLVHPAATIGPDTVLGEGTVVFAGVRVTTNTVLGRHVHLNQNATVGHDCEVADYVSVNPLAAVSGECRLERSCLIGTNASVLQGITVGEEAIVGAGACVVRDVRSGAVVVGVPARERSPLPPEPVLSARSTV
jgi:sugar O-acyltransferase (sialic acid O-acetyltransferase NeuD family)